MINLDDNKPTADMTEQVLIVLSAISEQEEIDLFISQLLSSKYQYDLSLLGKQTPPSVLQETDCEIIYHVL